MALKLVIANKNYSSWSFRPWIALMAAGISFEEEVISLNAPDFKPRLLAVSPAGKVPVLIDDDVHVWESLAILEYLGDKFPDAGIWPDEAAARAHARTIAAEMHAGFLPMRRHLPMNMWRSAAPRERPAEVEANVRRIDTMWTDCRRRFGGGGPFLFGAFGAADAMFAPVVSRFGTYGVEASAESRAYMASITGLPAWQEWRAAALREPWVLPEYEVDWPEIRRV